MRAKITLNVNQKPVVAEVDAPTLLVVFLREHLRLTGTHVGCDTSQCGACVVLVGGKSVKSCTMLALEADGAEVTTIEGLAHNGTLHPIQAAFHENHGLQCGFCTAGIVKNAVHLLGRLSRPSEAEVRTCLEGVLGGGKDYHNVVLPILQAGDN